MAKKKQPTRKQKHIPQRTCIACRQKVEKRRLTRLVRTPEDGVSIDLTGKRNGRGAYLCDQYRCWQMAVNRKLLNQALKTELSSAEISTISEYADTHTHKPS